MQNQTSSAPQAAPGDAPKPSTAQIAAMVEAAYILDAVRK